MLVTEFRDLTRITRPGLRRFERSWALSPVPMSVADIDDDAGPPLTRRTPVVFWECTAKPCADIVCMFE